MDQLEEELTQLVKLDSKEEVSRGLIMIKEYHEKHRDFTLEAFFYGIKCEKCNKDLYFKIHKSLDFKELDEYAVCKDCKMLYEAGTYLIH